MNSAFFALQDALYETLLAYAPLQNWLGSPARIYDHVPPDAVFPFITLGEIQAEPYDTANHNGMVQRVTLHIWSRQRGRQDIKAIMDSLYQRLHHGNFTIAGHKLVLCRFAGAEVLLDDDGLTYHGLTSYRIITQSL